MSMQTPMAKIIRRGPDIFTVDMAGREDLVSTSPTADIASWVLTGLRSFHKNTPVEEEDG